MPGLFAGTPLERPVTCELCAKPLEECRCPRDSSGRVLTPAEQKAIIRLEKRAKGKVVTTVTGLDESASQLPALLKRLKAACGAGGSLARDGMEIQGDHRHRIADELGAIGYKTQLR